MGVFDEKANDIITIRDEKNWEPHEQCRARTEVKVADTEWVNNQLVKITQGNRAQRRGAFRKDAEIDIQSQTAAANRLWVFRMLKDWTFTQGGQLMPLTLEAVRRLPQSVLDFIYEAIQAAQPNDEDEEEQARDEEGGKEQEGSAFFGDAYDSTGGGTSAIDEDLFLPETSTSNRNYLSKS